VTRFIKNAIPVSLSPIDLHALIDRALKSSANALESARIRLHASMPAEAVYVMGDETRLEQALMNLLSNAAKFTPPGGSVWVELSEREGEAHIVVRDNGAGIHPDDLPHIFEMYYQGKRVKTTA